MFGETCSRCHGENARGGVKDVRYMTPETHALFNAIVIDGIRKDKGMVGFADILTPADADAIHAYLIARANEDYKDRVLLRQLFAATSPGGHEFGERLLHGLGPDFVALRGGMQRIAHDSGRDAAVASRKPAPMSR